MNIDELFDVVRRLKDDGYFFGNQVLYEMAANSALTDKNQFACAMWLIGRSYAASPQRRSYGTDKKENWPQGNWSVFRN